MEFTAAQVLGWLTYLNRNLLHFWDHTRELIQPMVPVPKQNEERTQRRWRVYSEDQLRQLALLNRCYGMHLTPEFAAGVLSEPCRLRDTLAEPVLRPLLQLTEEMANAIHSGDHDQFWLSIARGAANVVSAEYCAVWQSSRKMAPKLLAGYGPHGTLRPNSHPLPMIDEATLETWRFRHRQTSCAINLFGSEVRQVAPGLSGVYSVLAKPLMRGTTEVGWIVAWNRHYGDQMANPASLFDPISEAEFDLIVAWVLGARTHFILIETLASTQDLLSGTQGLRKLLEHLLARAVEITGAFRGDICFYDPERDRLKLIATSGEVSTGKGLKPGEYLPNLSLCRAVFDERRTIEIDKIDAQQIELYTVNDETKSEFAVPMLVPLQLTAPPVGVINLEFEESHAFDRKDVRAVELLSQHATLIVQSIHSRDTIRFLLGTEESLRKHVRTADDTPATTALVRILNDVCHEAKIPYGVIFLGNYEEGTLEVRATHNVAIGDFRYGMHDRSITTKVFREGAPYFSANPRDDRFANHAGLDKFGINGPLLVSPLRMGPLVVGTMCLWGPQGANAPSHHTDLEPFTNLAFTSWYSKDRSRTFSEMAHLLAAMEQPHDDGKGGALESIYTIVSNALLNAGFERTRIFRLRADAINTYDLVTTGGSDPAETYAQVASKGISDCEYVVFTNRFYANKKDPMEPGAKPDPNAAILGKPLDLPWANAPIYVGSELFGYMAADNKLTRKPIRNVDVEAMSIISVIAGRLIANVLVPSK